MTYDATGTTRLLRWRRPVHPTAAAIALETPPLPYFVTAPSSRDPTLTNNPNSIDPTNERT